MECLRLTRQLNGLRWFCARFIASLTNQLARRNGRRVVFLLRSFGTIGFSLPCPQYAWLGQWSRTAFVPYYSLGILAWKGDINQWFQESSSPSSFFLGSSTLFSSFLGSSATAPGWRGIRGNPSRVWAVAEVVTSVHQCPDHSISQCDIRMWYQYQYQCLCLTFTLYCLSSPQVQYCTCGDVWTGRTTCFWYCLGRMYGYVHIPLLVGAVLTHMQPGHPLTWVLRNRHMQNSSFVLVTQFMIYLSVIVVWFRSLCVHWRRCPNSVTGQDVRALALSIRRRNTL